MTTPLGNGMSLVTDDIVFEEKPSLNETFKLDDTSAVNTLNASYTVAVDSKLNTTMDSDGLTESAANTTVVIESESNKAVTLQDITENENMLENEDVNYSGLMFHVRRPSRVGSDSSSYNDTSSKQPANFCKSGLDKVNLDTCQPFSPCHLLNAAFQNLKIEDLKGETSFIDESPQKVFENSSFVAQDVTEVVLNNLNQTFEKVPEIDDVISNDLSLVKSKEEVVVQLTNGSGNVDIVNILSSVEPCKENLGGTENIESEFEKDKFVQENTVTFVSPEEKEDVVSRPSINVFENSSFVAQDVTEVVLNNLNQTFEKVPEIVDVISNDLSLVKSKEEVVVQLTNGSGNVDIVNILSSVEPSKENLGGTENIESEFGKDKFVQENTVTVVSPEEKKDVVSRPSIDGVQDNPVRIGSPVDDKNAESTKTISVVEESNLASKERSLSDCSLIEVSKEDVPFAVSSTNITVIHRSETAEATTEMLSIIAGGDVSANLPQLEKNEEEVLVQHVQDLQLVENQEATLVKFGTAESSFVEHMNCLDQEIYTALLNASLSEYDQKSADFEKYCGLKLEINQMKQDVARLMLKITQKEREILMMSPHKMRFPSSNNVEESRKCADNDLEIKTLLSEIEYFKKSLNENENKLSTVESELEAAKETNVKYTQYILEAEALITAFSKKAEEAERDKKEVTDALYKMIEKYEYAKKIILEMKSKELAYKEAFEKLEAKTDNKENQRNN